MEADIIPVECVDGPAKGLLVDVESVGSTYVHPIELPNEWVEGTDGWVSCAMPPIDTEYRACLRRFPDGSEYMVMTCEGLEE